MRFKFAIIGGGLTATAMLCQLVDRMRVKSDLEMLNPSEIQIQVFERQEVFGPGFPHSDRFALPFHITNMCASEMGILAGNPRDFQDWVSNTSHELCRRFPWFLRLSSEVNAYPAECNHYPRAVMGEYLKARFREAVESAKQTGLAVDLYPRSEVVDLGENDGKIYLSIKDLKTDTHFSSHADRVLLATGHWFEKENQPHYYTSPWPAEKLLRHIPEGVTVAIIGTSLSAIETLLTLTKEGEFTRDATGEMVYAPPENCRRFCLYSRRGLLPKVRGKKGCHKNKFLNRENLGNLLSENRGNVTLGAVFQFLDSELKDAYGHPIDWQEIVNPSAKPADLLQKYLEDAVNGDSPGGALLWQTILHQTFDMVREVYLNLTIEDRKRFDRNFTSIFFTHAATQPAINAEKLLALMKAGIAQVRKLGDNYRMVRNEAENCYEFTYRDDLGVLKREAYKYVVNARGQEKSLETDPSELARNLIKSGTVLTEEIRGIEVEDRVNHSISSESQKAAEIYKTGSIWINPQTHRIMKMIPEEKLTESNKIYAVGAMTRGQIINASMASGIVEATSKIANDLVNYLTRNR